LRSRASIQEIDPIAPFVKGTDRMEEPMNKKALLVLTCVLFFACFGLQAFAQSTPDQAASQAANAASQAKDDASQALADPETKSKVQAKLQELSSELNLTDDQKTQLKPVLQGEYKQLKAVHDDSSLSADQKQSKMTEIHDGAKSQINSILTPEQQKKLADMKESHQDK
jgi:Spy/CpxP family protein refolding chaperone